MTPTLDVLRAKYPLLSFTLYAYVGQPITLECINPAGQTFTFVGDTEAEAILKGFADDFEQPESSAMPTPSTTNVFE